MKLLTKQQTFNKMVIGLLKQNAKSEKEGGGTCMFRGPYGLKCGVGQVILDELYCEEAENSIPHNILNSLPDDNYDYTEMDDSTCLLAQILLDSGVDIFDESVLKLMDDVQDLHDGCDVEDWYDEFKTMAGKRGLKMPRVRRPS